MAGKSEAKIDPLFEERVRGLFGDVKRARSLDALLVAMVELGRGDARGDAACAAAIKRMRHPFAYPTFGGDPPAETEPALSWDKTRLLQCDDGLESAKIVARRDANDQLAPPPGVRKDEIREKPAANDQGEPANTSELAEGEEADPGADPDAVRAAVEEALAERKVKLRKVLAERLPGGAGRIVITPTEHPRVEFKLKAAEWAKSPVAIARGIVQAMGGDE